MKAVQITVLLAGLAVLVLEHARVTRLKLEVNELTHLPIYASYSQLVTFPRHTCEFDNERGLMHYVQPSLKFAGMCHDTGSARFPESGRVIGRSLAAGPTGAGLMEVFESSPGGPWKQEP